MRRPKAGSILPPLPTPELIKAPTKQVRMLLRRLRLRRAGVNIDLEVTKLRLGPRAMADMPMAIHPDPINEHSVVYSFGVGRNLTWDNEMIRHFGVTIHAFDPTPGAVEWATTLNFYKKSNLFYFLRYF